MKPTGISRLTLLAALAGVCALGAANTPSGTDGKSIFLENKCSNCHSISAAGIARATAAPATTPKAPPDLSAVGTRHDRAFIIKFLQKEATIEGRKHLIKFKGTDEQLGTLASWLSGLKTAH